MQRTEDMLAIGQVLARYCRGIDRLDPDLIASVYWADAYDDHGPFKGGVAAFIAWIMAEMPVRHRVTNHALNQSYYEFRDNRAAVETHFAVRSKLGGDRADTFRVLSGRYLDLMEERGGEWRILHRTAMYDSCGDSTNVPLNFAHESGSRTRADLSYRIFENAAAERAA